MRDVQAVLFGSAMYWIGLNSVSDPDPLSERFETWLAVTLAIVFAWCLLELFKAIVRKRKSNAS